MANQKPKKVAKKPSTKPEAKKEALATPAVQTASAEPSLKGFFARKCDKNENILTIFKSPRIWGALIAELLGTMMIVMLLLTLGLAQPLYLIFAVVAVYVVMAGLSGANLNPIITVGMMATRRMSAIRGVLYILAQVLGAWIGLIIINAFRLSSGTVGELPMMEEVTGETFWVVTLVELLGAVIIAFCFARTLRYVRKNPLTFAFAIAGAMTLVIVVATIIANGYFGLADSFIFNPAAALMYQILPTTADGIGELLGMAGLALAAYVVFPMVGGVIGFYIADVATKLSAGGYLCEDDCVCNK
jgi:glycerol uptake facilitator-like aquaporin